MRFKGIAGLILALLATTSLGCAKVAFYKSENIPSENNSSKKIGLRINYAKPYLLVAPSSTDKNTMLANIVYLPDLNPENAIYADLEPGWGNANLTLNFTNGILTSVGQNTDSKLPDNISSLASMATSVASILALQKTSPAIQNLKKDIRDFVNKLETIQKDNSSLSSIDADGKIALIAAIKDLNKISKEEDTEISLKNIQETLNKVKNDLGLNDSLKNHDTVKKVINNINTLLEKIDKSSSGGENSVSVALYEIYYDALKKGIKLRKVTE